MFFKSFWRKKENQADKMSVSLNPTGDFKYKTSIDIRFTDVDLMGHVNNAVYLTYMEIGRSKYWKQAVNWNWDKIGVVIGEASISYLAPIFLDDNISIYVRTSRIGNSSFDLEYLITKTKDGKETICSKGKTICIAFDYNSKKAAPITNEERNKMIAFEQL